MKAVYLFAYGTLRRGSHSPMHPLLNAQAEWIDRGTLPGRLYLVDYYPGAVETGNPTEVIHGDLYLLHNPEAVLPQLDHYEGVEPDPGADYTRVERRITLDDGREHTAWVYLFTRSTDGLRLIEDGDFLGMK